MDSEITKAVVFEGFELLLAVLHAADRRDDSFDSPDVLEVGDDHPHASLVADFCEGV